jgi:hypothetical protein
MIAVNILNKQLWTANRGWPSSMGVGWGANKPPHHKTSNLIYDMNKSLKPGWILWNDPGTKKWI